MNWRTLRCLLVVWVLCDLIAYAGFIPLMGLVAPQFTTVTETVIDPRGLPYAFGTINATLALPGSISPALIGLQYIAPTQARGLDRNGHFIIQLADDTVLSPTAAKWNFLVCSASGTIQPAGGNGRACFSLASPIAVSGASQDISANVNAVTPALSFPTNSAASVLPIRKASIYGIGDVGITNAISNLVGGNGIVWADYSTSQTWASCPTWGSGNVHVMLNPVTFTIAVNCTIPANVMLEFMLGAMLAPANATTTTIVGIVIAEHQQIFTNALASQGTIVFTGNLKMDRFYPEWWGAVKDGGTNDLAALQATSEAADTVGAGTIDLGRGNYFIGAGTWKISNATAQHHLNILGQGPIATAIKSTVTGTNPAIYLNKEKYVHLGGFYLAQAGSVGNGIGMVMGGDAPVGGTATNGNLMDEIIFDSFNVCLGTSGLPGVATSSEITMVNLQFNNCTTGFNNARFNGLDFTFIQLQMASNTTGINMATAGLNVFGGSASNDGTDFRFANGGENTIHGFRSEVAGLFVNFSGSNLSLESCLVQGMTTPNTHTAITVATGQLTISDSYIGGQILGKSFVGLTIRNSEVIDGLNTYAATSAPIGMGPGFRIDPSANSGSHFESINNLQLNSNADGSVITTVGYWPSGIGYITAPQGSGHRTAVFTSANGQGAALTVISNAIQPTSYMHHVGAGLIKNITAADVYGFPFLGTCVQLIPDAAFTTDTTGNIAKASTAVIGQVMTMCYDSAAAKWYPSY